MITSVDRCKLVIEELYMFLSIKDLICSIGALRKEQIIRYFSDFMLSDRIEKVLNLLCERHILVFNEDLNCYSYGVKAIRKTKLIERITRAFWPIAEIGADEIREVVLSPVMSSQIIFVTQDNFVFDVAVINTRSEALIAERIRRELIPTEEKDSVIHIAIIPTAEDAGILKGCGFDDICLIDPVTNNVSYIALEDE